MDFTKGKGGSVEVFKEVEGGSIGLFNEGSEVRG